MSIVFAVETYAECEAEVTELTPLHYAEIAEHKDLLVLDPDRATYERLAAQNKMFVVTARDDERLIGYVVIFLHPHLHYRSVTVATDDMHFLLPGYRKGSTGYRMLGYARDAARARGAQLAVFRTKAAHDHGAVLKRLGFQPLDVVYAMKL